MLVQVGRRRRRRARAACCSRSTRSPTTRWRASASGRAPSSSPTTPSAGPGLQGLPPARRRARRRCAPLSNARARRRPPATRHYSRRAGDAGARRLLRPRRRALINPRRLDPERGLRGDPRGARWSRSRRASTRWTTARTTLRAHPRDVIPMPDGAAIFETIGPWEDYATPVARPAPADRHEGAARLPERIAPHPELFVLGGRAPAEAPRASSSSMHARRDRRRAPSPTPAATAAPGALTVARHLRAAASARDGLQPERLRRGPLGRRARQRQSTPPAAATAPAEQRARMETYREWFREGRRPAR